MYKKTSHNFSRKMRELGDGIIMHNTKINSYKIMK